MARYIDADALAEKKFQEPECKGFDEGVAYRCGWNDAIDAIMDNEPSADAQPVVRCKDCRHRYLDKKYGFRCDLDTGDPFDEGRSAENDDWFCADGVKMDGEQNDRT